MSKELQYRFCHLECKEGETTIHTSCWLEEKKRGVKIEPGVSVTLKDSADPDRWWTVISVSKNSISESRVKERQRIARGYRDATDI
jgi:hypothetical protein